MAKLAMGVWSLGPRRVWTTALSSVQCKTSIRCKWHLAQTQQVLATLGQRLNEVTGYSNIEKLKQAVLDKEREIENLRIEYRKAKDAYTRDVEERAARQKEANDLLRRRDTWRQEDIRRITELYNLEFNQDRVIEHTREHMESTEARFDEARVDLISLVSKRYHEEQVWSDKIRRASTWGTWALTAVNVVMFCLVQIVLEPYKRSRLISAFETRVQTRFDEIHNQFREYTRLQQTTFSPPTKEEPAHVQLPAWIQNCLPLSCSSVPRDTCVHVTWGLVGLVGLVCGVLLAKY